MKKLTRLFAAVLCVAMMLALLSGCGPTIMGDFDAKANHIYIQVYTGGIGRDWLDAIVKEFNEANYSDVSEEKWVVEVLTTDNKTDGGDFYDRFKSGVSEADIYFTSNPTMWQEMINGGYLLDLTDVYNSKPDGETGKTVAEKLAGADPVYENLYTLNGTANGIYGLPYADMFNGMVVNKEVFVRYNWFTAESTANQAAAEAGLGCSLKTATYEGRTVLVDAALSGNPTYADVVLTPGKDGKYGTFDDGQPTTVSEWEEMMALIAANNYKGFLWAGAYPEYTNSIVQSVMGQYLGADGMRQWLSFGDEPYTFTDRNGATLTVDSSNRANSFKNPALYNALKFLNDYVAKNAHSKSLNALETHTDTQGYFVYGEASSTMEKAAILCDGMWWEKEAAAKIASTDADAEYTYLMLPAFEGQAMASTDSYMYMSEAGSVFARNTDDSARAQKIKEFLSMTLSDKNLKHFTKETGCIRPYDYTLSEEELQQLTPFNRNCWEIYHSENVHFGRNSLMYNLASHGIYLNSEYTCSTSYLCPIQAFIKNVPVDTVFADMLTYQSGKVN